MGLICDNGIFIFCVEEIAIFGQIIFFDMNQGEYTNQMVVMVICFLMARVAVVKQKGFSSQVTYLTLNRIFLLSNLPTFSGLV